MEELRMANYKYAVYKHCFFKYASNMNIISSDNVLISLDVIQQNVQI
jgi:hypothetical protein